MYSTFLSTCALAPRFVHAYMSHFLISEEGNRVLAITSPLLRLVPFIDVCMIGMCLVKSEKREED